MRRKYESKLIEEILNLIDSRVEYDENTRKLAKTILLAFKNEGRKGVEKIVENMMEGKILDA